MKTRLILLFLLLGFTAKAQKDTFYVSTEVEQTVYAIDYSTATTKLQDFINTNSINIQNRKDSKNSIAIKFVLNQHQYEFYQSFISSLGNVTSNKVNTTNNFNLITEITLELNYLKNKRDSYNDLIKKIDDKSPNYLNLWNEQKIIEEKIFNKERELINLNKKENTYTISLNLNDETTSPENSNVSFINMPGIEYSYLTIESPKVGISSDIYNGYFLKYLFTKGKSYANIGVYKSNSLASTDSTSYSEIFMIGFGQDFYSKHLGRGSRKYFNLYSGYTLGGVMATGITSKENMFYISPSIGLEIFKNKYILIDSKVNYFVPFRDNRNLRGLSFNTSFNFVF